MDGREQLLGMTRAEQRVGEAPELLRKFCVAEPRTRIAPSSQDSRTSTATVHCLELHPGESPFRESLFEFGVDYDFHPSCQSPTHGIGEIGRASCRERV